MGRTLIRVVGLMLAMGATVVVSWLAVRGLSVFNGPGPFLDPSWYTIWAIQAGLTGLVGLVFGRAWGPDTPGKALVGLVLLAWIGELVVVTTLAPFLAGELSLVHGPFLWLVATGGLIQPLAMILGALAGKATLRQVTSAPAG